MTSMSPYTMNIFILLHDIISISRSENSLLSDMLYLHFYVHCPDFSYYFPSCSLSLPFPGLPFSSRPPFSFHSLVFSFGTSSHNLFMCTRLSQQTPKYIMSKSAHRIFTLCPPALPVSLNNPII